MRLRNIKGSKEFIEQSPFVVHHPEDYKGCWHNLFHNNNPVHLEIGMGKGQFIHTLAEQNPKINYIGIEMYSSVLYRALERRAETELDNLFFIRFDAKNLTDLFDISEVEQIYLNFSDPWPKDRHAKRRLTSPQFLSLYDKILSATGSIQFKTDNRALFDYSVESVKNSKWHIDELTYDLHHSEYLKGNIMTEYETRFVSEGKPICRFVISRTP
ncbi:MAG: tRNA (guanosine(46)-N7)-methyltransferase TrmB [Lachnospiraceae bacterium]|nr:tRNA (guanosine(46)-N7)-methyltransferase TrmB [Lachnospiraceae bacterium]